MAIFPLHFLNSHLFIEIEGALWLFDTGSPQSFGPPLHLDGKQFRLRSNLMGFNSETLSQYVGQECRGLLGADVLGGFDFILDTVQQRVTLSSGELDLEGVAVPLKMFMGIPQMRTLIRGTEYHMFFDTGAQFSYFQHDSLLSFPYVGRVTDFHPGVGEFEIDVYRVEVSIGNVLLSLTTGSLPTPLKGLLNMTDADGILGNELCKDRRVGYAPRRSVLYL